MLFPRREVIGAYTTFGVKIGLVISVCGPETWDQDGQEFASAPAIP
jgi:hypothetical protein